MTFTNLYKKYLVSGGFPVIPMFLISLPDWTDSRSNMGCDKQFRLPFMLVSHGWHGNMKCLLPLTPPVESGQYTSKNHKTRNNSEET